MWGDTPCARRPKSRYPQRMSFSTAVPSCLPGAQAQHLPRHSSLSSRSGSTDPLYTQNPLLGPPSDPVSLHLPPIVLTRRSHRLSPICLELGPLVLRLAKLPCPTDDGCPHHFCPQSTCEFYLFRKGLCLH